MADILTGKQTNKQKQHKKLETSTVFCKSWPKRIFKCEILLQIFKFEHM